MVSADGDDGTLVELVFLDHGPIAVRAAAVAVSAVAAGLAGAALTATQVSLLAHGVDAHSLNAVQLLLRQGSSAATAWPGWVAAACFAVALLRLRRGPLEPASGRASVDSLTPAQLRSGLRREYRAVRIALVAVLLLAALDSSRCIATGLAVEREVLDVAALPAALIEAAGYVVAAAVLALWAHRFGADLRRLGAVAR